MQATTQPLPIGMPIARRIECKIGLYNSWSMNVGIGPGHANACK